MKHWSDEHVLYALRLVRACNLCKKSQLYRLHDIDYSVYRLVWKYIICHVTPSDMRIKLSLLSVKIY